MSTRAFSSFAEFYPFYLGEHADRTSRRLHVVGSTVALGLLVAAVVRADWRFALAALLVGYAFAWVGHYFFEHNRPATFKHPVYSLMGDWRLWWETVTGKRPF
jgi:hypothetical protein